MEHLFVDLAHPPDRAVPRELLDAVQPLLAEIPSEPLVGQDAAHRVGDERPVAPPREAVRRERRCGDVAALGKHARYAGQDNILGKANVRFIEGANIIGIDESDSYAHDDVVTAELHLPVDRPVLFKFRSQDVLHSAYFPHFRAQMNVVPGMITQFGFTPTVTTDEIRETEYMVEKMERIQEIRQEENKRLVAEGSEPLADYENFDYFLLCNKICGTAHYNMQMKVIVETEEEFNAWMAEQQVYGETIETEEETQEEVEVVQVVN